MMSEEEAKKKWCPLSMVDEDSYQKCVGSDCMAWRASKETLTRRPGDPAPEGFREFLGNEDCTIYISTSGYCGLAGKDEK